MNVLEHPIHLILFLFLLSILPICIILGTSFLKLSIVLALLRNALGIQQVPPNMALYAIALVLTAYIMAPVGFQINEALKKHPIDFSTPTSAAQIDEQVILPYRQFLIRNTPVNQIQFFINMASRSWPESYKEYMSKDSLLILMPAFTIGQLIESFKMGLLLFLPFLAIDILVSILLLTLGMMMVSPLTIALPFKLLLFILMGGWDKLLSHLVLSYA